MKRHPRDGAGTAPAWLRIPLPVLIYLGALRALSLILSPGMGNLPPAQARSASVAAATLLITPAVLYRYRREARTPGARPRPQAAPALRGAGCGVVLGLLTALLSRALPGLRTATDAARMPGWLSALSLISLCIAGPACEETIYRGLVYRRCEALLEPRWAVLISSALFAAGHGMTARAPVAFVAGLVLCGVMLRERDACSGAALLPPILCHAAANAVLTLVQGFPIQF